MCACWQYWGWHGYIIQEGEDACVIDWLDTEEHMCC